ncbi:ParB/Srx family N-terminal domain-containing protein [Paraburkholderia sp. BR10936]|uniref:ParB/Srx family N-terminal domain-containing protein n=1 Tax=Paraburkholderia sp. BR10936 TaxID=3236993 RepID=UPI0034D1AB76
MAASKRRAAAQGADEPAPPALPEWPADRVERVPIDSLIFYARNARQHSDLQVAQIAASMREWGWTIPVLRAEDGTLIAGHGRILAARQLGFTEVPCMTAVGWSPQKIRAYVLADNKLAENATWDNTLLVGELEELRAAEFNLDLIGFTPVEIDKLLALDIDPLAHWQGMPEFEQEEMTFRTLHVHFRDQQAVDDFAALIGQEIGEKTKFVWHPKAEIDSYADKRYTTEGSSPDEPPEGGDAEAA